MTKTRDNPPLKTIHAPHHKIPTVKWNHWGNKESNAIKISLDEIRKKECYSSSSSQES